MNKINKIVKSELCLGCGMCEIVCTSQKYPIMIVGVKILGKHVGFCCKICPYGDGKACERVVDFLCE
jgi:hypothetical protein